MATWEKKETQNNEVELQTNKDSKVRRLLAVIGNRKQEFSIHREEVCTEPHNVFHFQICTSCASNYRRKERNFNFRNTGT